MPAVNNGPPRTLRSSLFWLGLLVTGVFTYLAVRDVRLAEAWAALEASNFWWLVPSLAVLAIFIVIRVLRWRYLFARPTRPPLRAVAGALLIGYLFNNILPARAGEVARVVALKQRAGTSRAETAATVVIERGYDVLCLLLLLFLALPWLPPVSWLRAAVYLGIAFAIMLAGAIAVLSIWGDRALGLALQPFGRLPFLRERIESVTRSLGLGLAGLRRGRIALAAFGWTLLSWLVLAISFWFVMLAFDLELSPIAALFVVIAVGLAMILPSSPGSLGVFEAAAVLALGAYGVSDSRALSYAIVLHAVNFFPYLVVGFLVLHRHTALMRRRARSLTPHPEM
jgi:glycosyltransferase 2 family protein